MTAIATLLAAERLVDTTRRQNQMRRGPVEGGG